jgi:hypothetical protein
MRYTCSAIRCVSSFAAPVLALAPLPDRTRWIDGRAEVRGSTACVVRCTAIGVGWEGALVEDSAAAG